MTVGRSRIHSDTSFEGFTEWGFAAATDVDGNLTPPPPTTTPRSSPSPSPTTSPTTAKETKENNYGSPGAARRRFGMAGKISHFPHPGFVCVLKTLNVGNEAEGDFGSDGDEGAEEGAERRNSFGKRRQRASATELNIAGRWRESRALLLATADDFDHHHAPLLEEEPPQQQLRQKATGIGLHFQRSRPLSELFASSG